ncbi:MAG: hypothetical protein R6U96_01570 [Promethearchaeia archaeon]
MSKKDCIVLKFNSKKRMLNVPIQIYAAVQKKLHAVICIIKNAKNMKKNSKVGET